MTSFTFGIDLGRVKDSTAGVMLQTAPGETRVAAIRFAHFPGGTSYAAQSAGLVDIIGYYRAHGPVTCLLDVTNGVGTEVAVEVANACRGAGAQVWWVMIHGGHKVRLDSMTWWVPKPDLVSAAQLALQAEFGDRRRLAVLPPKGSWTGPQKVEHERCAALLKTELKGFKTSLRANGGESYGNDAREAAHDDLVLAVSIGLWWTQRAGGGIVVPSEQGQQQAALKGRGWLDS
jgi:hypothetical protein